MALALYRKYRPGSFAEVVGQEHVTGPLQQAILNGRVHHAYLFSGPRGCGKTTSARVLARSLNCAAGPTPEPCGSCDSCVALAPNGPGSIDVIEIDAASHGGVDDARELRERAFFAPVSSRFKIYVIDEAHMVSKDGFNALLKLVEEPPEHVKLIFCTTEPEKVIGTIRSRTHHYPFRLMAPQVLRALLAKMCEDEGISVEPAVLPLVVRAGAGSARDGLSVLDQLLAGAGADGVSYKQAVALLGYTDENLLDQVIDAMTAGDGATVFETVDQVISSGHDPRRFAADLLQRLRDLVVLAAVPDVEHKGLIDAPPDQLERMRGQADRGGAAALTRAADIVSVALTEMRGATAPRLLLELMCARLLLPEAVGGEAALAARLDRMERRLRLVGAGGFDPAGTQPSPADTSHGGWSASGSGSPAAPTGGSPAAPAASAGGPGSGASQSADAVSPAGAVSPAASGGGQRSGGGSPAVPGGSSPAGGGSSAASGGGSAAGSGSSAGGGQSAGAGSSAATGGGRPGSGEGAAAAPGGSAAGGASTATSGGSADIGGASAAASGGGAATGGGQSPADGGASAPAAPPQEAAPPSPPAPAQAAPAGSRARDVTDISELRRLWPEVLEAVKARRRFAWMVLDGKAQVAAVEGNVLRLAFTREGDARGFSQNGCDTVLREALAETLGVDWRIEAAAGSAPAAAPSASASSSSSGYAAPLSDVPPPPDEPEPEPDYPDVDDAPDTGAAVPEQGLTGLPLLERELGARVIDEPPEPGAS